MTGAPLATAAVIVVVLAACGHHAAANKPPDGGSGAKMTPLERATEAFNEYAAKQFGVNPKKTDASVVGNVTLGKEIDPDLTIGNAWPFQAGKVSPDGSRLTDLMYGWATANGVAITMRDNFGVLLEQAGVWAAKPSAEISKLAKALAWSLHGFYTAGGDPKVELGPDGAGTVTIPLDYQEGGGGGYVSPVMKYNAVAKVTRDHKATVTLQKLP
jgi:hypothetical protein